MTIPEAIKIAKLFEETGGDAIEVSSGGIVLGFQSVRMTEPPIEAVMNMHHRYRNKSSLSKKILSAVLPFALKMLKPIHKYNVVAASEIK